MLTCYLLEIWFKETSGCFNSNWSSFLRWISINACTDTRKCLKIVKNQIYLVKSVRKNPLTLFVRNYHDFFEIDRIKDSNLQLSEDFAVQVCLMRYRNSFVIFVVLLLVDQQYEWYLKSKMKLNTMGCLCRTIFSYQESPKIFNTYFLMEAYNRKWALRPQFHTHEGSGILQATFFQPLCEWRHQLKKYSTDKWDLE